MESLNEQRSAIRWRTCAGCGQRMPAEELVRLVLAGDPPRLVPDLKRRAPGRGVHVQPQRACLSRAIERGGFGRSLRAPVKDSADELATLMRGHYVRRLESLVLAARRARKTALGTEAVREVIRARDVALLVVAEDAAGPRDVLLAQQSELGGRCLVWGSKGSWGRLFGRAELGVLAILDAGIAREVLVAAERAAKLAEDQ